jgi:hypothetical protein
MTSPLSVERRAYVDEVTASRLIFAPMGILLGKCCGNAASKIACGRSPNAGIALQQGARVIEDSRRTRAARV